MIFHDLTGIVLPADGADVTQVQSSDYKAAHLSPDSIVLSLTPSPLIITDQTWAIPAVRGEFNGMSAHRTRFPLLYVDAIRLQVQVLDNAGQGWILAQWSPDAIAWNSFDGAGGPTVNCNHMGVLDSGWKKLSATARAAADPYIRLAGEQGNGIKITTFGLITLTAR